MNEKLDVHPIVRQIVNRDCHVAWSNRQAIKHVASKLRHGLKTFRAMPREDRRRLMRECVQQHRENWELYVAVMYPSYRESTEEEA
jgi:hypothetical protein